MANAFYTKGKERILRGSVNFDTANIRAVLVSSSYTQNLATDEFYTTVEPFILNTPQTLTGKSTTGGVFDSSDPLFAAVTAGSTAKAVVLYQDTGTAASSPLIAFIDQIVGFPLATNGGDIVVQWDNGASRIFSL